MAKLALDVAVPVGKRIPPRTLNWLKQFAESHKRVLLYLEQIEQDGKFTGQQHVAGYGPPDFQREMAERFADGNVDLGVFAADPPTPEA